MVLSVIAKLEIRDREYVVCNAKNIYHFIDMVGVINLFTNGWL